MSSRAMSSTGGPTGAGDGRMTFHIPPPPFLADPALHAVLAALPGSRIVGGAVRDALLHPTAAPALALTPADIDLATPDPPERVMAALHAAGLKSAPTGLQHGTVTAISGGRGFEVTTLRRDDRTDGRHAEVSWTDDWREDAARRDFTFNAMSMQPDGTVFDEFGGRADLLAGRVRFVGDPARRIAEDTLRVLRFFRFHGRYGATPPDAPTAAALQAGATHLQSLSVERIWSELKRILVVPDAPGTVRLMAALGVLAAVLPGADPAAFERLVTAGAPPDPLLRLVALRPGTEAAQRYRLSNAEAAVLEGLAGPPPDPAWDDAALQRAMADTAPGALVGRAWIAGGDDAGWAALRARLGARRPMFPLQGRDVVALGVPMGPQVGRLLAAVRAWWLVGGCTADAAACREEMQRELARAGPG